ncbi:MAG TPA: hypothetical protein VLI05_05810 [Candidatus Saccharimonadia bacterium]|nr:hypothetical protein [Candidatus Saccharimonadia bacterium]
MSNAQEEALTKLLPRVQVVYSPWGKTAEERRMYQDQLFSDLARVAASWEERLQRLVGHGKG